MVTRICGQCGKSYQTFPSVNLQFCSKECSDDGKKNGKTVHCRQCGKEIYSRPARPRLFCSKSCARTASNLTAANPSFHRDVSGANNPMYGKGRRGEENPMYGKRKELSPRWKGGRKIRSDGYVLVVAPDGHPYPCDSHPASGLKYILEHRLVMERHLGRYLLPEEVVHHRDENPQNNSIENLELLPNQAEHARRHKKKSI